MFFILAHSAGNFMWFMNNFFVLHNMCVCVPMRENDFMCFMTLDLTLVFQFSSVG